MGCNNCGNKSKRHQPTILVKNVDEKTPDLVTELKQGSFHTHTAVAPKAAPQSPVFSEADKPSNPPEITNENPVSAFQEAKKLSFEDIMQRLEQQKKVTDMEIERAYSEMTDAMRHFHVLTLLSIANYENLAAPGMSPEQAVVSLQNALSRKDFNFINDLYPGLIDKVGFRYRELMAKKILL